MNITIMKVKHGVSKEFAEKREYKIIKEYPKYYLCEYIINGKILYKECFLKIDIDGVPDVKRTSPRMGWNK